MKRTKQILAMVLCVALAAAIIPMTAYAAIDVSGDVISISSTEDLNELNTMLTDANPPNINGKTVELTNNIDGVLTVPNTVTTLTIDGNGYSIDNTLDSCSINCLGEINLTLRDIEVDYHRPPAFAVELEAGGTLTILGNVDLTGGLSIPGGTLDLGQLTGEFSATSNIIAIDQPGNIIYPNGLPDNQKYNGTGKGYFLDMTKGIAPTISNAAATRTGAATATVSFDTTVAGTAYIIIRPMYNPDDVAASIVAQPPEPEMPYDELFKEMATVQGNSYPVSAGTVTLTGVKLANAPNVPGIGNAIPTDVPAADLRDYRCLVWIRVDNGQGNFSNGLVQRIEPFSGSTTTPPQTTPPNSGRTVNPTPSKVFVNGAEKSFEAYNIGGSNYFKLRDIAMVLNGTNKQFEVGYDNSSKAITMTSGEPYTPVGGEMTAGDGKAKTASLTASKISLDGDELSFEVYNIGGSNFFKLVDLMSALDIGVTYNAATKEIKVDTNAVYTGVVAVTDAA